MARTKYNYTRVTYVDPFPGRDDAEVLHVAYCHRCGGAGGFKAYGHIDGGKCFECHGTGGAHNVTVGMERADARRLVNSTNRRNLENAKRLLRFEANLAAAVEARPEWARSKDLENDFVSELRGKMYKYELTARQIEAGADAILRHEEATEGKRAEAARLAAMEPLEAGRREVSGVVRAVKSEDSAYGYGNKVDWKMLLELESGHRVWGTIPSALFDLLNADREDGDAWIPYDGLRGRTVSLTATVSASDRDPSFGFYSRPTKPVLAPAE